MAISPASSQAILRPANPLFIAFTLLVATLLEMLPINRGWILPDFLALVLVFWNIWQPRRIGVGVAWCFGMVMDVHSGGVFGEHALAYTLLAYAATSIHRRLLWFDLPSQALQILPLFAAAHLVSFAVRMFAGGMLPGWSALLAPVFEAVHALQWLAGGLIALLAFATVGLVANLIGLAVLRSGSKESLNVKGAYLEVLGDTLGSAAVIVAAKPSTSLSSCRRAKGPTAPRPWREPMPVTMTATTPQVGGMLAL